MKTGSEVEDLLVYPIVYNARHSIELSLKIVIKMLWRIEEKKGICYSEEVLKERKKELHTHSIECLYKLACDKKNIDRRIPAYFENIEDMIYFYYEEGDAFKYELNKEDEPHMIKNKISHVSIELLETEFKEVMKKFDDLIYFLDNCIFEYSLEHLPRACREQIYGIFRSGFLYMKNGEQRNSKKSKMRLSKNIISEVKNFQML